MLNIQLSNELTKIAQSLATQKNVSVDKIIEEALISLQNQIDESENTHHKAALFFDQSDENDNRFNEKMDEYMERFKAAQPELLKSILEAGVPIAYVDDQGRCVKKMPSGEIIVLNEELK